MPLRTIFSFKNAQFKCNSKNGRILVVLGHKHQHIILRRCSNNILILTLAAPSSDHNFYSTAMCYKSQKNDRLRCCTSKMIGHVCITCFYYFNSADTSINFYKLKSYRCPKFDGHAAMQILEVQVEQKRNLGRLKDSFSKSRKDVLIM